MQICGHTIDKSQIIGIGPIMLSRKQSGIYLNCKIFFQLHLKYHSIRIETEDIPVLNGLTEEQQRFKDSWEADYYRAVEEIKRIVLE